jgi:hypothetical protein
MSSVWQLFDSFNNLWTQFCEDLKIKEPAVPVFKKFENQRNCKVSSFSNFRSEGSL